MVARAGSTPAPGTAQPANEREKPVNEIKIEMRGITEAVRCGYCPCVGAEITDTAFHNHAWCSCSGDRDAQWEVAVYIDGAPCPNVVIPACEFCCSRIINAASTRTAALQEAALAEAGYTPCEGRADDPCPF